MWVAGDTYTFEATGAETDGRLAVWPSRPRISPRLVRPDPLVDARYSARNVRAGSSLAARRAGSHDAPTPAAAKSAATVTNVTGSLGVTP